MKRLNIWITMNATTTPFNERLQDATASLIKRIESHQWINWISPRASFYIKMVTSNDMHVNFFNSLANGDDYKKKYIRFSNEGQFVYILFKRIKPFFVWIQKKTISFDAFVFIMAIYPNIFKRYPFKQLAIFWADKVEHPSNCRNCSKHWFIESYYLLRWKYFR